MPVEKLQTIRVETGISFGQECYLNPSRAQEFLSRLNAKVSRTSLLVAISNACLKVFTLGNFDDTKQCAVRPNSFNYTVYWIR